MTEEIRVTKRSGSVEPWHIAKLSQVVSRALLDADGNKYEGVYASQLELKARIQFYDLIPTSEIHDMLIKAAADLISPAAPNYQYVAADLLMMKLRKVAYSSNTSPTLLTHITKMVSAGIYDKALAKEYTTDEIEWLETHLDHSRDKKLAYAGAKQWETKYLTQNRVTGRVYDTPNMACMMVAMGLHCEEVERYGVSREARMDHVKDYYDYLSLFHISNPTPIMSGVRSPTRQFSSCVLLEQGDSMDSIKATSNAILDYVTMRAGIGHNFGQMRALDSPIRGGEARHTGCIPFLKRTQADVTSCSAGGVRDGACTSYYPWWHREFEALIVLKNNRGTDDNRVRKIDYGLQLNRFMYRAYQKDLKVALFSPSEVPGLYDAFAADQDEFDRLYDMYSKDNSIEKVWINARDLWDQFVSERAGVGRIFVQNIDLCNTHGPFIPERALIKQSNLCLEIALPTEALGELHKRRPESGLMGEIALCTLSAFNLGVIDPFNFDEMKRVSAAIVRALDNLLDYQDYPCPEAEVPAKSRRSLGIGWINQAYYIAKHGLKYSDGSANNLMHRTIESIQWHLLNASADLAIERGPCAWFEDTKYSRGELPIDWYKKNVDKLHTAELGMDWEGLRFKISETGLRHSTVTTEPPTETSSQISNSTNGMEQPRGPMSVKASKDGILRQIVPGYGEVEYEYKWDAPDCKGYLDLSAIMQKFTDQSLSTNTPYDPNKFPGGKVPAKLITEHVFQAYVNGTKTLYYFEVRDDSDDIQAIEDDGCSSGACKL